MEIRSPELLLNRTVRARPDRRSLHALPLTFRRARRPHETAGFTSFLSIGACACTGSIPATHSGPE
ncbi:unnamed protein product, partial [Nesidiocoris tenuis]